MRNLFGKKNDERRLEASRNAERARSASLPVNRCCICRQNLDEGYAVLFTNPDGNEGRICKQCCDSIGVLANGEDKREVADALAYFGAFKTVGPTAQRHLERFVKLAKEYLQEK